MVATLLRLVGIDVKRLTRETAITIVLAIRLFAGGSGAH
jgi:hypothetical protein